MLNCWGSAVAVWPLVKTAKCSSGTKSCRTTSLRTICCFVSSLGIQVFWHVVQLWPKRRLAWSRHTALSESFCNRHVLEEREIHSLQYRYSLLSQEENEVLQSKHELGFASPLDDRFVIIITIIIVISVRNCLVSVRLLCT